MRKLLLAFALAAAMLVGSTDTASARSDRACLGELVSTLARLPGPHGQFLVQEHKPLFHPFGAAVSQAAQCRM